MRQRHSNPLGRREAIFAVKNHAVTAIEHEYGCAGTLVLTLMDVQVRVFKLEGELNTFTAHGGKQRFADIEVQRVAEFVLFRGAG